MRAQQCVFVVPAARDLRGRGCRRSGRGQRQGPLGIDVIVDAEAELLEVVSARGPAGRFPSCLHGRQQEAHERANDGDHDQEFHEGEPPRPTSVDGTQRPHTTAGHIVRLSCQHDSLPIPDSASRGTRFALKRLFRRRPKKCQKMKNRCKIPVTTAARGAAGIGPAGVSPPRR